MQHGRVRILKWVGLTGAAVLLFTGCPEDAVDIVEPKATAINFDVSPLASMVFPSGLVSVDRFELAQFDTSIPDAFGRASYFGTPPELPGYFGGAVWAFFEPAHRSADPRLPLLTWDSQVTTTGNGLFVAAPASEGLGHYFFIISGVLENLPPNTQYTLALVRYGLRVNAEVDQEAVLLGNPITQPDELVLLNANPLGDPTVNLGVCGAPTNRGDTIFAQVNANPFIIGSGMIDSNGCADPGIVIRSETSGGTPVFFAGLDDPPTTAQQDSFMFGRNDNVGYQLPRYNYVVMFEGLGVTGNPIVRWQVGQDLLLTDESPVNNARLPFPTQAFTTEQLVGAPGGAGRPDSITVEFTKVEPLSGGVWQAWLVNRDESPITVEPATATYQRVAIIRDVDPVTGEVLSETDSVLETVPGTGTFTGQLDVDLGGTIGVQEVKHRLIITANTTGGGTSAPGFFTDVVLTSEPGTGATSPSVSSALWFQYTDQKGTPSDFFDDASSGGSLLFGHFDLQNIAGSRVLSAAEFGQSSGLGGVLDVGGNLVEVSVDLRNLPLPPQGFFYEGWLYNPETGNAIAMGPITALPPDTVSLFDADIDQSLPGVTRTGIRFANARVVLDDPNAILTRDGDQVTINLSNFFLTLEPKLGADSKNVSDVEIGTLPTQIISKRSP